MPQRTLGLGLGSFALLGLLVAGVTFFPELRRLVRMKRM
jgi:hypothetical protein